MPEIRFYATKDDLALVFESMHSELGLIAYEMVAEPSEPLRRFQTLAELSSHFRYCGKQCDLFGGTQSRCRRIYRRNSNSIQKNARVTRFDIRLSLP